MARKDKTLIMRKPRGAFGDAMHNARIRATRRFAFVTVELIADVIGVSKAAYYAYEAGTRKPDRDFLIRLGKFYGPYKVTRSELEEAYDLTYGQGLQVDSVLVVVEKLKPYTFAQKLPLICYEANCLYDDGDVRGGYDLARSIWDIAVKQDIPIKPTYQLALVLARATSQLGDHRESVAILEEARLLAGQDVEPAMLSAIELSLAACNNRLLRKRGFHAADEYFRVVEAIRSRCALHDPLTHSDWSWIWCDAHRSRLISLTTSLDPVQEGFLKSLLPEFERLTNRVGHIQLTRDNTYSRVEAAIGDPDVALNLIAALDNKSEIFADHAFHACSRAIAVFRTGEVDDAISEAQLWADKCRQKQMIHKQNGFLDLVNVMIQRLGK